MRIHFLSIGGSVMHNLALVLKGQGHEVTGSDDEIYEPSRSRLKKAGLLPASVGWDPNKITKTIDLVILGMHAKANNPELQKSMQLGLNVISYPEFIYKHAENKTRIVVGGSHGKTTTTAIIMYVLRRNNIDFDYLIGANLRGFDQMVRISDAEIMIIEGDEYLSSAIDRQPKLMHYHPHLAVLTGISWDHMNVFPTEEIYFRQFELFVNSLSDQSVLIYHSGDPLLRNVVRHRKNFLRTVGYTGFKRNDKGLIIYNDRKYSSLLFGSHNDQNLQAAFLVCQELGISDEEFFQAAAKFQGAEKRLQRISNNLPVYLDFAHAPSKVRATVQAIRNRYADCILITFLELHTFSSLNKKFIPQYRNSLDLADEAFVFCHDATFEHKKMERIDENELREAFGNPRIGVIYDPNMLKKKLSDARDQKNAVILIMSSGNLGGIDVKGIFGP